MRILITGGTGLIGTEITKQLQDKAHEVIYLSRNPGSNSMGAKEYAWDPETGKIDLKAFEGTDAIINLAGAPINKRWTPSYKSTILRSRVDGTRLLFNTVQKHQFPIKAFISASAVGYYQHSYTKMHSVEDPPGSDFLSLVCQKWEQEAQNFEQLNIRTVRCRIGIVLSEKGGALPEIAKPVKLGAGAPLGKGKQWMPWIHLQDLAAVFTHTLENENCEGVYNAVGPYNVTNDEFTKAVADVLHRPYFMPAVPAFALKLALGEMATTALISTKVDNNRLSKSGFSYRFSDLKEALQDLLK